MKIGLAVPGYIGHIKYIYELLDSYENGTVKPDQVAISLSSMPEEGFKLEKNYSFPVEIVCTPIKQNPAQNRNIAKKLLNTDIITFMDIDDIADPHRLEFIKRAFDENPGVDCLIHNYVPRHEFGNVHDIQHYNFLNKGIDVRYGLYTINISQSCYPTSFVVSRNPCWVMHSQPSVLAKYASRFDYDENLQEMIDDIMYLQLLHKEGANFAFLENRLSHYRPAS